VAGIEYRGALYEWPVTWPNGYRRHPFKGDRLPDVSRAAHYWAAVTAQVVLLAYFELSILVPLGRWNDQPGISVPFSSGNIILGGAIGGAQFLLLIGTVRRLKPLMWSGLLGDTVWLFLHIYSLWIPYTLSVLRRSTPRCMRASSAALPSCCRTSGITLRQTRCTSLLMCW
jgi:hypothetical protein